MFEFIMIVLLSWRDSRYPSRMECLIGMYLGTCNIEIEFLQCCHFLLIRRLVHQTSNEAICTLSNGHYKLDLYML